MAFTPQPGKFASVSVGSLSFAFDNWEADETMALPDVSNFLGNGAVQRTTGLIDGKISIKGPYDEGNMPFILGQPYTLILGWNATPVTISFPVILQNIKASQDVKDAGRIQLVFMTNGVFTAAII
jgi:hypothetical protein